ncbi:DUF421 domain-containing protein [Planctomycetales bacterium 10988]|nr:DUF421 domain-containing protein [Planctomycetales bacterium 10988]
MDFFMPDSWRTLTETAICGIVGYFILTFFIRLIGKRATAKMNNFDWIVTVAVGSTYASMTLLRDITVMEGGLAMVVLLTLQYLVTGATARWSWARSMFLSRPTLLYADGQFFERQMINQRVCREEILSAIRESGAGSLEDAYAVILEPDAELSVIMKESKGNLETLKSVSGHQKLGLE